MLKLFLLCILAVGLLAVQHKEDYEKFFEVEGGPEYMYYFSKFYVGTPAVE